jgi:hypothetical protein
MFCLLKYCILFAAAYLVVKVQEGADDEAAKENGTTAKKSFAVILDRLEISLKLQRQYTQFKKLISVR